VHADRYPVLVGGRKVRVRTLLGMITIATLLSAAITRVAYAASAQINDLPVTHKIALMLKVDATASSGRLPAKFGCLRGLIDQTRMSVGEAKNTNFLNTAKFEWRPLRRLAGLYEPISSARPSTQTKSLHRPSRPSPYSLQPHAQRESNAHFAKPKRTICLSYLYDR
jgi:hypothetical protein